MSMITCVEMAGLTVDGDLHAYVIDSEHRKGKVVLCNEHLMAILSNPPELKMEEKCTLCGRNMHAIWCKSFDLQANVDTSGYIKGCLNCDVETEEHQVELVHVKPSDAADAVVGALAMADELLALRRFFGAIADMALYAEADNAEIAQSTLTTLLDGVDITWRVQAVKLRQDAQKAAETAREHPQT